MARERIRLNDDERKRNVIPDITATVTLESIAPYHQSKHYEVPKLEGESAADYDLRNWREHLHVYDGTVHIPARAIFMSLVDAARYKGEKIAGERGKTWTGKFAVGISILQDIDLGIKPEDVDYIDIWANLDGKRNGSIRGNRRFPKISQWSATFDVKVLDPIITQSIFEEMFDYAGMYVGIGQYRPQNRGTAGRFNLTAIDWREELRPIVRRSQIRQPLQRAAE